MEEGGVVTDMGRMQWDVMILLLGEVEWFGGEAEWGN